MDVRSSAPQPPPLHQETRAVLELSALLRSPTWRLQGVPEGDGTPVVLLPGFMAGDASLSLMAGWLGRLGYRPRRSGIVSNVDCSEQAMIRLERRLETVVLEAGRPAFVIGHSRGGMFARVLAVRRPELVAGIVTLGTPHLATMHDLHPVLQRQIDALCRLGDRGAQVISSRCRIGAPEMDERHPDGGCCEAFWAHMGHDFPAEVAFASVYSHLDAIVRWEACLDPHAEHVEVRSSHCGMGMHAQVYRVVAEWLADLGAQTEPEPDRRAA